MASSKACTILITSYITLELYIYIINVTVTDSPGSTLSGKSLCNTMMFLSLTFLNSLKPFVVSVRKLRKETYFVRWQIGTKHWHPWTHGFVFIFQHWLIILQNKDLTSKIIRIVPVHPKFSKFPRHVGNVIRDCLGVLFKISKHAYRKFPDKGFSWKNRVVGLSTCRQTAWATDTFL